MPVIKNKQTKKQCQKNYSDQLSTEDVSSKSDNVLLRTAVKTRIVYKGDMVDEGSGQRVCTHVQVYHPTALLLTSVFLTGRGLCGAGAEGSVREG